MISARSAGTDLGTLIIRRASAFCAILSVAWAICLPGPLRGQTTAPWPTNGSNVWWTTGNVGIGTASPTTKFDIQGPSSGNGGRVTFTDNGNYSPYMAMYRWTGAASNYYQTTIGNMIDNNNGALSFQTGGGGGAAIGFDTQTTRMIILGNSGNVGIGTTAPQSKLAVNGTITTREVIVTNTGWSDYVFRPDYRLQPLNEVAAYVKEHHHLPQIPSEAEVQEKGVSVGEMQAKLLAKIEELTLHAIQADERNNRLVQQNRELQDRMARLEARNPSESGAKQ